MEQRGAARVTRRLLACLRGHDLGQSLIEFVVAITVFAIMIGAIAETISGGLDLARTDRDRSVAANLASSVLSDARVRGYAALWPLIGTPGANSSTTSTVNGVNYTVSRYLSAVTFGGGSACQANGGAQPAMIQVVGVVNIPASGAIPPVQNSTLIRPTTAGQYSPTQGSLALTVVDRNGNGLPGVTVDATNSSGTSLTPITTDTSGCAFFPQVAPDTYTVGPNLAGYVDPQGNANPTSTVSVAAGQIGNAGQMQYDQSSTLQVMVTAPDGGAFSSDVSNLPVTLRNTAFPGNGLQSIPGTGLPRTVSGLFPSSSGYGAWLGDCADSAPSPFPISQPPPASVSESVPSVSVAATQTSNPLSGATITATHAADSGCASGYSLTLGTTSTLGTLVAALPYGTWTISDGSASQAVTLTTAGSGTTAVVLAS